MFEIVMKNLDFCLFTKLNVTEIFVSNVGIDNSKKIR